MTKVYQTVKVISFPICLMNIFAEMKNPGMKLLKILNFDRQFQMYGKYRISSEEEK